MNTQTTLEHATIKLPFCVCAGFEWVPDCWALCGRDRDDESLHGCFGTGFGARALAQDLDRLRAGGFVCRCEMNKEWVRYTCQLMLDPVWPCSFCFGRVFISNTPPAGTDAVGTEFTISLCVSFSVHNSLRNSANVYAHTQVRVLR